MKFKNTAPSTLHSNFKPVVSFFSSVYWKYFDLTVMHSLGFTPSMYWRLLLIFQKIGKNAEVIGSSFELYLNSRDEEMVGEVFFKLHWYIDTVCCKSSSENKVSLSWLCVDTIQLHPLNFFYASPNAIWTWFIGRPCSSENDRVRELGWIWARGLPVSKENLLKDLQ